MITDPSEDYARGYVDFLGCTIFLDSHPLIPRTETEFWTEKAAGMIYHTGRRVRVLDLFAGSGCVGIAVLKHALNTQVDFGEKETRHFPTIQKSLAANNLTSDVGYLETDVWSGVPGRYDFVLANPPYVAVLTPGLGQEPPEALYAADGGFALIEKTVRGAAAHLAEGGQLWLEHDPEHAPRLASLGAELGFSVETHQDQYGIPRYSVMA